MFLGKILYSHSASLHAGAQMGTDKFNAGVDPAMDDTVHVHVASYPGRSTVPSCFMLLKPR